MDNSYKGDKFSEIYRLLYRKTPFNSKISQISINYLLATVASVPACITINK